MATHSSILARKIPWTEELGGLQSMESQESDMTQPLNNNIHEHSDGNTLSICQWCAEKQTTRCWHPNATGWTNSQAWSQNESQTDKVNPEEKFADLFFIILWFTQSSQWISEWNMSQKTQVRKNTMLLCISKHCSMISSKKLNRCFPYPSYASMTDLFYETSIGNMDLILANTKICYPWAVGYVQGDQAPGTFESPPE